MCGCHECSHWITIDAKVDREVFLRAIDDIAGLGFRSKCDHRTVDRVGADLHTVVIVVDAIVMNVGHRTRQRCPPREVIELHVILAGSEIADLVKPVDVCGRSAFHYIIQATGTTI